MDSKNYPHEIKDLEPEELAEIYKYFMEGHQQGYLRIGPKGYCFSDGIKEDAPKLYNMPLRPDDVFVITFPKAGTTWTQELVWMVANDLDYEKSNSMPLPARFPYLEIMFLLNNKYAQELLEALLNGDKQRLELYSLLKKPGSEMAAALASPRFLKTHMPFSLMPPSLLDTTKVVYVARDPRDVVVSYYHHIKFFKFYGFTGTFKNYWECFLKNLVDYAPFFPHVLEAWEQRNHPNMLFIFYEDMLHDLPAAVRRVAKFFGKQLSEEQVAQLTDHLSFHNFKNNRSVNYEFFRDLGFADENRSFIRKGKSGDWRDHFDEEMAAQAARWMEENLRGTDLKFPHYENK